MSSHDLYRDDFSTRHDAIMRDYAERMARLEADHRAEMAAILKNASGAADAPAQDLAQGQTAGASTAGSLPAGPGGPGPGQHPDPRAADAELARELRDMDMTTYMRRRADLGVRSQTDMSHLFGETR
jgi:hypothetical protein